VGLYNTSHSILMKYPIKFHYFTIFTTGPRLFLVVKTGSSLNNHKIHKDHILRSNYGGSYWWPWAIAAPSILSEKRGFGEPSIGSREMGVHGAVWTWAISMKLYSEWTTWWLVLVSLYWFLHVSWWLSMTFWGTTSEKHGEIAVN